MKIPVNSLNKKLIFFDVDGTILTEGEKKYVPESTVEALKKLHENGHLLFINTGRTEAEFDESLMKYGFDGVINACGGQITYKNEVIFYHPLDRETRDRISRAMTGYDFEWIFEGKNFIYFDKNGYKSRLGRFKPMFSALCKEKVTDAYAGDRGLDFDKLVFYLKDGSDKAESDLKSFKSSFGDRMEFIDRGNSAFEVIPKGCSKASGMQFLMDHFNIPKEDTIAIGDSTNDLSMLEFAGTSICMGNGDDKAKAAVDIVTDDIDNDGLYNAFKDLGLI
ncbi:MAG: HAD family hydrolase [Lachnospiraceae bacterium]|jgi:Cof subfamily protein (haloacid dehalogenase superfamily)|nr:HAD family hydrolase [Lachnospiraceae bacterium]MEE3460361.1 HAD family hydrolase [Lachnospiraceae bacterium]